MKKLSMVAMALLLGLGGGNAERPAVHQADQFAAVRAAIQRTLDSGAVSSTAVAVAKNGRILWEEGFGVADRESRRSATKDTLYSLASISKPFTSTGLLTLVE